MRVLLAGSLTLAALGLAACGSSSGGSSTPAADNVSVSLGQGSEFSLVAAPGKVKAGKVTFTARNDGKVHHEMVVVPLTSGGTPKALATSTGEANEDGSPGEIDGIDPGQTRSVTLALKPGTYVLLCNEPGHFAGGMATTFTVD